MLIPGWPETKLVICDYKPCCNLKWSKGWAQQKNKISLGLYQQSGRFLYQFSVWDLCLGEAKFITFITFVTYVTFNTFITFIITFTCVTFESVSKTCFPSWHNFSAVKFPKSTVYVFQRSKNNLLAQNINKCTYRPKTIASPKNLPNRITHI